MISEMNVPGNMKRQSISNINKSSSKKDIGYLGTTFIGSASFLKTLLKDTTKRKRW